MANFDRFERLKSKLNNERRKLNESGFRFEPEGSMGLTSNFNDIMPFVSTYERIVMKEFPECGTIDNALGGYDLFDAMSDGELTDETAVDWVVDKVRDNCDDEECDEVEVNESKLNEGAANFYGNGGADWLPLLVFVNSDDIYADLHREADDLYSEIDDDDERREKIDAYIDTYFDERLGDGICGLTDDDIENLENELYLFNEKMRARGEELAYGEGSDDDAQYQRGIVLKDLKVELKPGYYEGVQLFCDIDGDESFLTEDDKNELIEFFKKIKKDFNLTELAVAYRASNGETGYSIVDDEVKGDDESKEESLKEGAKAVSIEKKDGEVEDTLVFDSYDEAHEYLELLAKAKKYPYHEIVEDSYETDNGLLLIGYANYNEDDKLPEDEIEHILVKYSTEEQNDANENKEGELGESKKHSDDEINDAYFGAMRFFSKGGKDPEEFLAKHPNADADAVRSAFDNFKAGNKWKELKKEKEDSLEEDKTSVKEYNDRMQKIFDDAKKLRLAQKDFLIKHGVSEEEADKLYQDTGLHGSPLQQKLIDLGINDEFFAKYDFKTGELKEGNVTKDDSEKGLCDIEESFEDEVKGILKPRVIDGDMIKPFADDEKLPRGFRFLASTAGQNQRGYVRYKGDRYWFEVKDGDVEVMRESAENPYVAKHKEKESDGVHVNLNAGNPERNAQLFNQSMGFAESLNEEDEGKEDDKSDISNEFGSNVKDEWDAIEGYNTLESEIKSSGLSDEEKEKLLSIIDDIRSEEYRHVGQLQQALKTVTDDADKIDDGEKEAESQEQSSEHEDEHVDEVDVIDTEISEVENDAE